MASATEVLSATGASTPTETKTTLPGSDFKPPSWADSVQDPELKGWLQNKSYPDAEHALKAHRSLEQLMGADKAGRTVLIPKDENDADGWKAVASKLGVPASADGYKLPMPEGMDDGFAKTAATWFHKAGVPPRAANLIAQEWNTWIGEQVKLNEQTETAESEKQMNALKTEWGSKADENIELARRGFRQFGEKFGLSAEAMKRAESVLGASNLVKFFHGLGSLNAESSFAGSGDGGSRFGPSQQEMNRQIGLWRADRMNGKISDYQWEKEIAPQIEKMFKQMAT